MLNKLKDKKGFTLIEIVLVLAIAGLILVIVFLAVSGAQRSRRDSQRKNDLSRIAAQLEQFASNNNGCYPESAATPGCAGTPNWATFWTTYIVTAGNFNDPLSGDAYQVGPVSAAPPVRPAAATPAGVNYILAQDCQGAAAGNRAYAVRMGLESGPFDCRTTR